MKKSNNKEQKPVELSKFMLLNLRFLQVFGLCPISMCLMEEPNDNGHSRCQQQPQQQPQNKIIHKYLRFAWQWLHIFAVLFVYIWILLADTALVFYNDRLGTFTNSIKLSAATFAHITTLIEPLFKRQYMQDFLVMYLKIHRTWATLNLKQDAYIYRRFVGNASVFIVLLITVESTYILQIQHKSLWLKFFVGFMPSTMVCYFRSLQFILFLELVRIEVEQLNGKITQLVVFSRTLQERMRKSAKSTIEHFEEDICAEIKCLMENYVEIFEMTELLKKCTAFSIYVNYIKAYINILMACYWSYWVIYNKENIHEYFLILPPAFMMFLLLTTSRNCMRSIENFSLQLMHQQIVIEACGVFVLNCNMARDIMGSVTTYMIFFIQFMPRFKSI